MFEYIQNESPNFTDCKNMITSFVLIDSFYIRLKLYLNEC